jgi:general secretion pathway protein K
MKQAFRGARRQQGMAVVSALIVVAAVAALTTGLFLRQTSMVRQVENDQARVQARWLLTGGLDWARLVIGESLRREGIVHDGQLWTLPIQDTRLEHGSDGPAAVFSGHIEDEQGKFNLYNVSKNGLILPDQVAVLQRLLAGLGVRDDLGQRLAQQVAMTQPVKAVTSPDGAIISQSSDPLAPMPRGVEDLAALLQVQPAVREAMTRTMTLLPAATEINVNTAPAEVLAALEPKLSLAQARALVAERERGTWFNDAADFANHLSGLGIPDAAPAVTTTSAWFSATGIVVYQRARVSMRALIQSGGDQSTNIVWEREIH